jgi:hypothetical protein
MLLNPADPDQRYALLTQFGLSDLVPALNTHVQAALQLQDAFERWIESPQGPPPLTVKPWFDPQIHLNERIKWLNTDKMRDIIAKQPQVELIVTLHLQQLQQLLAPPPMPAGPGGPPPAGPPGPQPPHGNGGGAGMGMANSNRNSAAMHTLPQGTAQHGPTPGPM